MANQVLTDGDTIEINGVKLECIHVSYRERDGARENYTYSFREQSEMEAERKEQKQIQEAEEKARQESEENTNRGESQE